MPENLLRFYIHFTSAMSRGEAYRHLKLIDTATKKPVHAPFLELEEELWSPDGKRFTLFIDPGRIKRGLKPREMFGPVLEAGKSYCLVVDRGLDRRDGNTRFSRIFAGVSGPGRRMNRCRTRRSGRSCLRKPALVTRSVVRFPEPLDRALLERLVGVLDPDREVVRARFRSPKRKRSGDSFLRIRGAPGTYRLAVGSELEDVAGNSVGFAVRSRHDHPDHEASDVRASGRAVRGSERSKLALDPPRGMNPKRRRRRLKRVAARGRIVTRGVSEGGSSEWWREEE